MRNDLELAKSLSHLLEDAQDQDLISDVGMEAYIRDLPGRLAAEPADSDTPTQPGIELPTEPQRSSSPGDEVAGAAVMAGVLLFFLMLGLRVCGHA